MDAFGEEIWLIDGGSVMSYGFEYPTRSAIFRLSDGSLVVWSPVGLTEAIRTGVATLGTVAYLIAPNTLHHLAIADWSAAFPDAAIWAPRALASKRPDLTFAGFLDNGAPASWGGELDYHIVPHKITTEAVFFHRPSKTVLFTDLIQQFPPGFHKGWQGIVARLDLMTGDRPNVPRKFRLGFGSKPKARALVKPILDWPADKVVMAHGAPVTSNGQAQLRQTFDWLF
ncbi:DUF4336 domain-containing protein [Yoonia litorea]|uniref:DUF4336 domain-containing protein n=1 Tax=Yoonia litorea TaxID=1123755 RepID=A0A1I6M5G4_9RHOB|nr:DUF4336 domain-containing protein [Yoonia litorea]SFS10950.1 protein of unknown function [Yoonia litorea]